MGNSMKMLRAVASALVAALLVLGVARAAGQVIIDDPNNVLGGKRADVEQAARRLASQGPDVVIMVVRNDNGSPQDGRGGIPYINQRLAQIGVGGTVNSLPGRTILFFRSTDSKHSALYFVPQYRSKLEPQTNQIYETRMRPSFTKDDVAGGMVEGINGVQQVLYPPTSPLVYGLVGGAVVLGLLAFLVPQFQKRRAIGVATVSSRERAESSRKAAGSSIADLGQAVRVAQEKAQYDRVSYGPADVERLTQLQSQGEQLFVQAQDQFQLAEASYSAVVAKPTPEGFEKAAGAFDEARTKAELATQAIQSVEQQRVDLDRVAQQPSGPSTGPTQRL
ncbi:MAG: hypothetical protein NVS4B8_00460 [Herpetosiphon sp.]